MYVFGLISGCLCIIGAIPYIYNTYRRKTKPHRISWLIFLILSVLFFTSQLQLGARASLFFYGWTVINNVILFSLSMRKGGGYGDVNLVNVASFGVAILAIALWKIDNSPLTALICTIIADGIGALLIIVKSYKHPQTETIFMWYVGIASTLFNMLAVGKLDPSLLAAPMYVFLFNIAIVAAILLGRRAKPLRSSRATS